MRFWDYTKEIARKATVEYFRPLVRFHKSMAGKKCDRKRKGAEK